MLKLVNFKLKSLAISCEVNIPSVTAFYALLRQLKKFPIKILVDSTIQISRITYPRYTILVMTNCLDLFANIRIELMNFRNLVCTAFLVNVIWFTWVRLAEISHYVLKNIRLIPRKPNSNNQPWLNTHGLMTIA